MISIIIPFYNEAESIPALVEQLNNQLNKLKREFELILVNDASADNPQSVIRNLSNVKLFNHKKRLGKGEALKTGVENSIGETIVFMDGDLQDDPSDLPEFLEKIQEGNDLVNGIREKRNDNVVVKFYSKIVAWFLKTFLNSPYTDINCGYKVFNRKVLKEFVFYGNNFRFFPLAVFYNGYKVTEINVKNNKRMFGRSKFGPGKLFTGLFDTLTAYFLFKFSEKPLHFFGMIGGSTFFIGFVIALYLTIERLFFGVLLVTRPLLWLGILLIIIGIQIIMTGIIGELIVYQNKRMINHK